MQPDNPRPPRVEFLWWRECPSWERALSELREEMAAQGLDAGTLELVEVRSEEEALRLRFPGSPTVRVDDRDAGGGDGEGAFGLTCRVYRRADGRVSPLPEREQIKAALRAARGGGRR